MVKKLKIGQLLVQHGVLEEEDLNKILRVQRQTHRPLGEYVIEIGFCTEDQLSDLLSQQLDIPYVNLTFRKISEEILKLIPQKIIKSKKVLPLERNEKGELTVAMLQPWDLGIVNDLEFLTGAKIIPVLSARSQLEKMLRKYYNVHYFDDALRLTDLERKMLNDLITKVAHKRAAKEREKAKKTAFSGTRVLSLDEVENPQSITEHLTEEGLRDVEVDIPIGKKKKSFDGIVGDVDFIDVEKETVEVDEHKELQESYKLIDDDDAKEIKLLYSLLASALKNSSPVIYLEPNAKKRFACSLSYWWSSTNC